MSLDNLAVAANALAIMSSSGTIGYMVWKKLNNHHLFCQQFFNIAACSVSVYYFSLMSTPLGANFFYMDMVKNIATMLSLLTGLFAGQVDCDILAAFSVLNPAISPSRIKIIRAVLIGIFFLFFIPILIINILNFVGGAAVTKLQYMVNALLSACLALSMLLYGTPIANHLCRQCSSDLPANLGFQS